MDQLDAHFPGVNKRIMDPERLGVSSHFVQQHKANFRVSLDNQLILRKTANEIHQNDNVADEGQQVEQDAQAAESIDYYY